MRSDNEVAQSLSVAGCAATNIAVVLLLLLVLATYLMIAVTVCLLNIVVVACA
jgi:hypothetical protein